MVIYLNIEYVLYDSISRNFCDTGQCRQDNK